MKIRYALALVLAGCGGGGSDVDPTLMTPEQAAAAYDHKATIQRCYTDCEGAEAPEPNHILLGTRKVRNLDYQVWAPQYGSEPSSLTWSGGDVVYASSDGGFAAQHPDLAVGGRLVLDDPDEVRRAPHTLTAYRNEDNSISWYDEADNLVSQQWYEMTFTAGNLYPVERLSMWTPATGTTVIDIQDNIIYIWKADGHAEAIELLWQQVNEMVREFEVGPGVPPSWIFQFKWGAEPGVDPNPIRTRSPTSPARSTAMKCSNCAGGRAP